MSNVTELWDIERREARKAARKADPIFAAIHQARQAYAAMTYKYDIEPEDEDGCDLSNEQWSAAVARVLLMTPASRDGLNSYCEFVAEVADWLERGDLGALGQYWPGGGINAPRGANLSAQDMILRTLMVATRRLSA